MDSVIQTSVEKTNRFFDELDGRAIPAKQVGYFIVSDIGNQDLQNISEA
jgi:hypothetical protein